MINNLEALIELKLGTRKKREFGLLLWPDTPMETQNHKIQLNNRVKNLCNNDPKTLSYKVLNRICEILELTKMDQLWNPTNETTK